MKYNIVYHITHKSHLSNILKESQLKSPIDCIYVCPTYEDALKFIAFSGKWRIDECVILALHLPNNLPSKWQISLDHNKKHIPAAAIIYMDSRLPFLKADVISFK